MSACRVNGTCTVFTLQYKYEGSVTSARTIHRSSAAGFPGQDGTESKSAWDKTQVLLTNGVWANKNAIYLLFCKMFVLTAVCSWPIHNNSKQWSLTTLSLFRRVRKTAKRDYWLRHVCLSVPPAWNNSAPTGRIFMKLDMSIFRKSVKKNRVSWSSDKNNTYLTWRPIHLFDHISFSFS